MLLGVDVGGTFTDAALLDGERLISAKAPSTPKDQSEGVLNAVEAALEKAGAKASDVERFVHGMTVGTNALLEGKVARTALVATAGFTDLEELGRQARPQVYRLCAGHPPPLRPPHPPLPGPPAAARAAAPARRRRRALRTRWRHSRARRGSPARAPRRSRRGRGGRSLPPLGLPPQAARGTGRGARGRRHSRVELPRHRRGLPRVRALRDDGGRRRALPPPAP